MAKFGNVLVTGGAGFVGSNLVKMLVEDGNTVTVFDDFSTGYRSNITSQHVSIVTGDVRDYDRVREVMHGKEAVFHLAVRNIIKSVDDPKGDFEVNALGTANVLLAARECSVGRVLYTSSASVYGNAGIIPTCEDSKINILSPYSASKYAGECACVSFHNQFDVPVATVRLSNVYGYNQRPENPYCGVISKFVRNAITNDPITIYGDGTQTRDFTHVDDACDAIMMIAAKPEFAGRVFNVATQEETSVLKLAEMVIVACQSSSEVKFDVKRRIDSVNRRALSIAKLTSLTKWAPKITIKAGLAKTLDWILEDMRAR